MSKEIAVKIQMGSVKKIQATLAKKNMIGSCTWD